jgi:nitrile hydratase beta subunit
MGGLDGFGRVVEDGVEAPYHEAWEPRVFAMWAITAAEALGQGSGRVLREKMPPQEYLSASYYERWQWSNERRLLARGTIAEGEVDGWVERLREGETPPAHVDPAQESRVLDVVRTATEELGPVAQTCFRPGDLIRVRRWEPVGHTRCPHYARGVAGVITAVRGTHPLPDEGRGQGEIEPVYAVSFRSGDLFGESDEPLWTVILDLHESYLEAA